MARRRKRVKRVQRKPGASDHTRKKKRATGPHPQIAVEEFAIEALPNIGKWFADLTGEYVGRPGKLTRALHEKMVALVLAGNYPVIAAQALGISEQLFSLWKMDYLKKGEESKYALLMQHLAQAEAMSHADLVEQARKQSRLPAKETNSQATMSFLERRFSTKQARWIPKSATELSGPDGGPIENAESVSQNFISKLEAVEASIKQLSAPDGNGDEEGVDDEEED